MKKYLVIGLMFLLVGSVIISGCGQQVPEIKSQSTTINSTIPMPLGLVIKGTVYSRVLGSTNNGSTLTGVILTISGSSDSVSTTSNSNGEFVFSNLPSNSSSVATTIGYIIVATKEGYQKIGTSLTFGNGALVQDNTVLTADITLNPRPVVSSITPALGTTVDATATFVVTFNKAMDVTTVRPTLTSQGLRTAAVGDTASITTSWSTDKKTLTLTPTGNLYSNMTYRLNVDPGVTARDLAGNVLDTAPGGYSGGLAQNEYTSGQTSYYYRTSSGGAPGAPSSMTIYSSTYAAAFSSEAGGITYAQIMANPNLNLQWSPSTTGNVNGYRIYVARSSSGPWLYLNNPTTAYLTTNVTNIITALFGAGSALDPINTRNYPFINEKIYFRAVAYNAEGESASAEVNAVKLFAPVLNATAQKPAYAGGILTNFYFLPALATNEVYIAFQEPIDRTSITSSNFTVEATATDSTVTSATHITSSMTTLGGPWVVVGSCYSIIKVKTNKDLTVGDAGRKIHVQGVKDLYGNTMTHATVTIN